MLLDYRHPYNATRPLIYYDAVLCLLPAQLGGANIGVILALIAPETILLSMAMLVVGYAWYKTWTKLRHIIDIENTSSTNTNDMSNPLLVDNTTKRCVDLDDRDEASTSSHRINNSQRKFVGTF